MLIYRLKDSSRNASKKRSLINERFNFVLYNNKICFPKWSCNVPLITLFHECWRIKQISVFFVFFLFFIFYELSWNWYAYNVNHVCLVCRVFICRRLSRAHKEFGSEGEGV